MSEAEARGSGRELSGIRKHTYCTAWNAARQVRKILFHINQELTVQCRDGRSQEADAGFF